MSYLDRLRAEDAKKVFAGTPSPTKPTKAPNAANLKPPKPTEPGFVSSAGADPPLKTFAGEVDDLELPPLAEVQEAARRDVLARLEADPESKRAFVTRFERDTLIVALAVRAIGTCELSIRPDRFNGTSLADFQTLARCLEDAA